MVKISVIIPVYNVEKYIAFCLESVLNQSFTEYEVILVDDGSTDRSWEICQKYANKDSRVTVLRQKNAGVSAARNVGIQKAKGKYVTFIDSDDWIEPEYLTTMISCMQPKGFVAEHLVINETRSMQSSMIEEFTSAEAQISVFSCDGIGGFAVARMFDLSIIMKYGIRYSEDIAICEDLLFSIMYLSVVEGSIVFMNQAEYHYRTRNDSAVLGRYGHNPPRLKDFTEFTALEQTEHYLVDDERVRAAWLQRRDKAAVATLRTMISCNYTGYHEIKRLKKVIRKGLLRYIFGDIGSFSGKFSMLISAISPELEWQIFKMKWNKR